MGTHRQLLSEGRTSTEMVALVIEQSGEIKERFGYEIPFNETTQQSILEYARAHYGSNAIVREMTKAEKANFSPRDRDWFTTKW